MSPTVIAIIVAGTIANAAAWFWCGCRIGRRKGYAQGFSDGIEASQGLISTASKLVMRQLHEQPSGTYILTETGIHRIQ